MKNRIKFLQHKGFHVYNPKRHPYTEWRNGKQIGLPVVAVAFLVALPIRDFRTSPIRQ